MANPGKFGSMKVFVVAFFSLLLIGQYTMLKFIHQNHEESLANPSTSSLVGQKQLKEQMNKFKKAALSNKLLMEETVKHKTSSIGQEEYKPPSLLNHKFDIQDWNIKKPLLESMKTQSYHHRQQQVFNSRMMERKQGKQRIAVVIPYIGPELPSWFPIFAASCEKSESVADWLIFTAGTRVPSSKHDINNWLPLNIKFIELGISGLAELHARLVDPADRVEATKLFQESLHSKPYGLVEFKPAVGHIFQKYLSNYSHWCFSDLDLIMGDLPHWTDELLGGPHQTPPWDIFTYSFGDQFRMYTRGQWTVHPNVDKVNQLWRKCEFMEGRSLMNRLSMGSRYQSAEGCYALAVSTTRDIRVKYAVKVFTDADADDDKRREVVMSQGLILKPAFTSSMPFFAQPPHALANWLISPNLMQDIQLKQELKETEMRQLELVPHDLNSLERVTRSAKQSCMYWVGGQFQTCMDKLKEVRSGSLSGTNLHLVNGETFKVPYHTMPYLIKARGKAGFEDQDKEIVMISGVFFHFQEWKKQYKSWATHLPPHGLKQGILATKDGFIPLPFNTQKPLSSSSSSSSSNRIQPISADESDVLQDMELEYPWIYRTRGSLQYCLIYDSGSKKCKHKYHGADLKPLMFMDSFMRENLMSIHGSSNEEGALLSSHKIKNKIYKDDSIEETSHEKLNSKNNLFELTSSSVFLRNLELFHRKEMDIYDVTLVMGLWLFKENGLAGDHGSSSSRNGEGNYNLIHWLVQSAYEWVGPKSIVVGVCEEESQDIEDQLTSVFNQVYGDDDKDDKETNKSMDLNFLDFLFIVKVKCIGSSHIENNKYSEKALLNAATDLVITRYILPLPVGVSLTPTTYPKLKEKFKFLRSLDSVGVSKGDSSSKNQQVLDKSVSIIMPLFEKVSTSCESGEYVPSHEDNSKTRPKEKMQEFIGETLKRCEEEPPHEHGDMDSSSSRRRPLSFPSKHFPPSSQGHANFDHAKFKQMSLEEKQQLFRSNPDIAMQYSRMTSREEDKGNSQPSEDPKPFQCELHPSSSNEWLDKFKKMSPDSMLAAPLVAYDLYLPISNSRHMGLRWIEELPFGCLDGAQAWAYKELGGEFVQLKLDSEGGGGSGLRTSLGKQHVEEEGEVVYGLFSNSFMRSPVNRWDCGCNKLKGTLDLWNSYKRFIRRAAAFHDAL